MTANSEKTVRVLSVREETAFCEAAISYIAARWASERSRPVYENCIGSCIDSPSPLPQWYLLTADGGICGCAGLIPNDFISRMDLCPWLCALFVEERFRGRAWGRLLIERAKSDAAAFGYRNLYLATDHVGYYERYGFSYIGTGYHPWGESSRILRAPLNGIEKTGDLP